MREPSDPGELARLKLLRATLEVAVPLEITRLRESWERRGLAPEAVWTEIRDEARGAAEFLAGPAGADVLYRSKREGETARALAQLARGLACLSFCPGGVTAFGLRFEASPETARALAQLARGLACLSFCPGGVTAFGLRFEASPGLDWLGAGANESVRGSSRR